MIFHLKAPRQAPHLRFEWHDDTKRLYFVRIGADPEVGEIVAETVTSPDHARFLVMIWLRGYKEAGFKIIGA